MEGCFAIYCLHAKGIFPENIRLCFTFFICSCKSSIYQRYVPKITKNVQRRNKTDDSDPDMDLKDSYVTNKSCLHVFWLRRPDWSRDILNEKFDVSATIIRGFFRKVERASQRRQMRNSKEEAERAHCKSVSQRYQRR